MRGPGPTAPVAAAWLAAAALTVFSGCSGESGPRVRLVHAAPDRGPADLVIDGEVRVSGITFGHTSGWFEVPESALVEARGAASASTFLTASGDTLVVLSASAGVPFLTPSRLPRPARRGVELLVVSGPRRESERTIVSVPDRVGLVASSRADEASSLIVPAGTELLHVATTAFTRDIPLPRLATGSRIALVPCGHDEASATSMDAPFLLAIDLEVAADASTFVLPPSPRLHAVLAPSLSSRLVRVAGQEVRACVLDRSCTTEAVEVSGSRATVEIAELDGTIVSAIEIVDLAPGDDRLVVASGTADAVTWAVVPARMQPVELLSRGSVEYVHAAPALGPITIYPDADYRASERRPLAPNQVLEADVLFRAGIGRPDGAVVRAIERNAFGMITGVGFVVLTSETSDLETMDAAFVDVAGTWTVQPLSVVPP